MKKLFFFGLFCSVCLVFCKKDAFSPSKFFECAKTESLSETEMRDLLLGEWDWFYVIHGWTAKESGTERLGLRLFFKNDGRVEVFQNDTLKSTADWALKSTNGEFYLVSEPWLHEIGGGLRTCDGKINFDSRAGDGDSYFYEKK